MSALECRVMTMVVQSLFWRRDKYSMMYSPRFLASKLSWQASSRFLLLAAAGGFGMGGLQDSLPLQLNDLGRKWECGFLSG